MNNTAIATTARTELTIIVTFPNGQECTRVMSYNCDAVEAVAKVQKARTGPYALRTGETYRIEEITAC
jgi:hypothetical protein